MLTLSPAFLITRCIQIHSQQTIVERSREKTCEIFLSHYLRGHFYEISFSTAVIAFDSKILANTTVSCLISPMKCSSSDADGIDNDESAVSTGLSIESFIF